MDTLIELIVRGLIALFTGRSDQQPPQKITPRVPPKLPQSPTARRPVQQPRLTPMQRQQAMLQEMMRRGIGPKKKKIAAPPPAPRPVVAAPLPRAVSQASARPQAIRPSISAATISQLISSRPAA